MTDVTTQTARVAAALTAAWIRRECRREVVIQTPDAIDPQLPLLSLALGDARAAVAVVPLYDPNADAETLRRKAAAERRLTELGLDSLVVWVPPAADIPIDDADQFVARIAQATDGLSAGERTEVGFPVKLGLRKTADDGSYLSAVGGLAPHWARFTGQVVGQFQLDSSALHRLPEDPATVTQLIDFIVLLANGIRAAGRTVEVDAQDTWIVQRLAGPMPPTLMAASPATTPDDGAAVRKALRSGLQRAAAALLSDGADVKIITFVGIYRSMEQENAAIALRGTDPALFAPIDFACLAADGTIKPLLGPRPGSLLST